MGGIGWRENHVTTVYIYENFKKCQIQCFEKEMVSTFPPNVHHRHWHMSLTWIQFYSMSVYLFVFYYAHGYMNILWASMKNTTHFIWPWTHRNPYEYLELGIHEYTWPILSIFWHLEIQFYSHLLNVFPNLTLGTLAIHSAEYLSLNWMSHTEGWS